MKTPAWQRDLEQYPFRHVLAPQYSHLDTIRHVNNVAVHGLHVEARIRHQLSVLGGESLFSDTVLLRPRRTVTHFLRETHYPHDITCAARLLSLNETNYRIVTALFQQGECVGVQDCLMGAWHEDDWQPLPSTVHAALARQLDGVPVSSEQTSSRWPQAPCGHVPMAGFPVKAAVSGRYADLDPDVVIGELAVSRFIEQSRAGTLRPIRNDPALGMLVASVDLSYHRWHRGTGDIDVVCGIERIGNSSFDLAGAAATGAERLASARSTMVLIDRDRRRPTPITETLCEAMAPLFVDTSDAEAAYESVAGRR